MGHLDGKVAIVTGGGRGIGREVAKALAADGAKVIVNDLGCDVDGTGSSHEPADRVVAEITSAGGQAVANYDDMSVMANGERIVQQAVDTYGTLDILVTSTGTLLDKMIWDMTESDFNRVLDNNQKAMFVPVKFASILFRQERKGRLIFMVSDAGLGAVGRSNYAGATEGALGLSRTCARDLGRYGVTSNAISPLVRTRLFPGDVAAQVRPAGVMSAEDQAGIAARSPWAPWEGPGDPDDPANVGPLAVYLCTDQAANINGQLFGIRGGTIYIYNYPTVRRSIHRWGGRFPIDELDYVMPQTMLVGIQDPAPRAVAR
jgi:NAD(P)-dependent dehydrogenase (short-subunit alcohol dehydrogenase family)